MTQRQLEPSSTPAAIAFPVTSLMDHASRLAKIEAEVISRLSSQTQDDVIKTRENAKLLSETAWRIECACDASLIAGAKNMRKKGRAGDTEHAGIMSAVRRHAKKIGVTPQTIFKNAQIHRLITEAESKNPEMSTSLRLLSERKYFVVALMAADPLSALELFIIKKRALTRFRTTDAERLLEREGLLKKSVASNAVNSARASMSALSTRAAEIDHINKTIELVRAQVIPKTTSEDIIRVHQGYIEDLNDYVQEYLFDEDTAILLRKAWRSGNHNEVELSDATKLPLETVRREMGILFANEEFIKVPGDGPQKWHMVGLPLPDELTNKRKAS